MARSTPPPREAYGLAAFHATHVADRSAASIPLPAHDPAVPLSLLGRRAKKVDPTKTDPATIDPATGEAPPLIQALLGRTEPELSELDQRALRACLRLAGAPLPLVGFFDADFYAALAGYKAANDLPRDDRVDLPTMNHVVAAAVAAVGGPGRWFHRARGAIFDVFEVPHLVAEAPGILPLLAELKEGFGERRRH